VWMQRGPLEDAIRASIAIPGVITPHVLGGRLLADGGILDPIPMAPIAAVNADATIAVSLAGDDPLTQRGWGDTSLTADLLNRMWRSTSSLLETKAARSLLETQTGRAVLGRLTASDGDGVEAAEEQSVPVAPKLGGFEVMYRTIDIAQGALARHTLAAYPPDLLIEVPRTVCRSLDFHRANEVLEIGQELASVALDALDDVS
jgi:NTE family protein